MSWLLDLLNCRFPENDVAPAHFGELLQQYIDSGIARADLRQELASGDEGKLWSYIWEAMLFRHLSSLKFQFNRAKARKSGQLRPDFGIICGDRTVWIEAIAPAPEGIPLDWLEPPRAGEFRVRTMPADQMLLRWTAAIKEKTAKFRRYAEEAVIDRVDCNVIAINSCRLSDFITDDHGISQLPFALEAVFPVGPLGIPISKEGKLDGEPTRIPRFSIKNANQADVPTDCFLNPENSFISAVLGSNRNHLLDGNSRITVVHNPLAENPLPRGILGATKEFVAEPEGSDYILRQISLT